MQKSPIALDSSTYKHHPRMTENLHLSLFGSFPTWFLGFRILFCFCRAVLLPLGFLALPHCLLFLNDYSLTSPPRSLWCISIMACCLSPFLRFLFAPARSREPCYLVKVAIRLDWVRLSKSITSALPGVRHNTQEPSRTSTGPLHWLEQHVESTLHQTCLQICVVSIGLWARNS